MCRRPAYQDACIRRTSMWKDMFPTCLLYTNVSVENCFNACRIELILCLDAVVCFRASQWFFFFFVCFLLFLFLFHFSLYHCTGARRNVGIPSATASSWLACVHRASTSWYNDTFGIQHTHTTYKGNNCYVK